MSSKCSKVKWNREPPNETRLARECAIITSFPWSVVLSTNQSARNRSVLVKAIIDITDHTIGSQNVQDSRITTSHRKSVSLQSFQSSKVQFNQLFFFLPSWWLVGTRVLASHCDSWLLRQKTSCVLVERKFTAVPGSKDRPKQQFALCALITCADMWNCLPLLNDIVAGASRTN